MPATPKKTLWSLNPVTQAKHRLLHCYLEWWFPAMLQQHKQIHYLDGFAGPGEYLGGEIGSPLVALEALLKYTTDPHQLRRVTFTFIDERPDRCAHLNRLIQERILTPYQLTDKDLNYHIEPYEFKKTIDTRLTQMEKRAELQPPIFAFIDPFGFKDIPMYHIERLLRIPQCETLITVMYEEPNRFFGHPDEEIQQHFTNLFGGDQWKDLIPLRRRSQAFCDLYQEQLRLRGNVDYTCALRLKNERTIKYFLVFGTRNAAHLEQMKESCWEIAPQDGYTFSESTRFQLPLLSPDYPQLAKQIHKHFQGSTATIDQIDDYILMHTRLRRSDRQPLLSHLAPYLTFAPEPNTADF